MNAVPARAPRTHVGYIARSPVGIKGASKEPVEEQRAATAAVVEVLAGAVPEQHGPW